MFRHHSGKFHLTAIGSDRFKKEYKKLREIIRVGRIKDQEKLIRVNERIEELKLALKSDELIKIPLEFMAVLDKKFYKRKK